MPTDYLRLRALPFGEEVAEFVASHDRVYVVDQNRDGQMYDILRLELPADALKLRSIRHYDGFPLDAETVVEGIEAGEKKSMSSAAEPKAPPTNRIGLTVKEYGGLKSTLCVGCGHDVITRQITQAFYDMGVAPYKVAKMSGIGCSSKTTAYFADRGHGFNAVHGRMPAVATGAVLANQTLLAIGVSGDGDTASIGTGQFVHLLRRNVPMIYIVENNGVYGLTKGQFSATADLGSKLKTGVVNEIPAIDLCAIAIELGCAYVARSFSGDMKQLVALAQGGDRPPGDRAPGRHLPLRDLQQPRGLDQVLQVGQGPRDADPGDRLRPLLRGDHRGLRPGHDAGRRAPRRLAYPR